MATVMLAQVLAAYIDLIMPHSYYSTLISTPLPHASVCVGGGGGGI